MDKKEAYQIVLDDLMQCDLFRGRYDAKHGASEHYMYGICTVMEAIACRISEKTGDAFSDIFILNMIKSEEKNEAISEHTETHEIRTETHERELIERAEAQAAIMFAARRYTVAHEAHGVGHVVWSDELISVNDAMQSLRDVQTYVSSGNSERLRPKGEWIVDEGQQVLMQKAIADGEDWKVCSVCGCGFMVGHEYNTDRTYHKTFHNFCPNCGADMRGGDNETD